MIIDTIFLVIIISLLQSIENHVKILSPLGLIKKFEGIYICANKS